jgi:hypothetical protein
MLDGLPGPRRLEDRERLVEHSRTLAVVELLARDRVLAGELVAPEPDAQGEAAVAQPVKGRGLARDLAGRRRASGVIIGPSRMRSVAPAIAARVTCGSATAVTGSRQRS